LALGGAYAAVADDPGAMIWNPAGLVRVDRRNIYASHSNLIGLGFSEQLGLVALPNLKLGTFGLGLRRFGVDGIEGRDDRGAIFADNLKDSETEILLGYGRTIGGLWNLGAVFKYQQHNLAGYSDGAPGLDLGVMVKPLEAAGRRSRLADALTAGLTIRNLIEPNLRLDEEGVKDPTGLRFGLAYDDEMSDNLHLLVATDLEKTRDMDTRLHAGVELSLMKLLALRLGTNAGMLTAGAGVRYRDLAVDYTFEDNPLDPVHRFGLGMAFGPTTGESRQASLDAQAAELRKQLASAYQRDNAERVQHMVAQVQKALDDGDFAEALNRIETVAVLEPGYPGLDQFKAAAFFGQGQASEAADDLSGAAISYQRCLVNAPDHAQAEQGLQRVSLRSSQLSARSAEIRKQFDAALEAYARGDLVEAKEGFAAILELQPDDREAAALLRNTTQTLDLRAGSLLEQAQAQAMAGNLVAARANLDKARIMAPTHRGLAAATEAINAQERRRAAAAEASRLASQNNGPEAEVAPVQPAPVAKPSFASLSAKDKQEVADLYQSGLQAVEESRHDDAIRYWELVWSRAPDYQQVAENLKQEYLAQGMEAFADGHLDQSIEIWKRAQTVVPGDAKTNGYLARAYEHKSRIQEIKGDR